MKFGIWNIALTCCFGVAFSTSSAYALTEECQVVATCTQATVPTEAAACVAATPTCENRGQDDRFAVTATQLAQRAISIPQCDTKTFTRRQACNACYQAAKVPLQHRYKTKLFHGLLATAASIVDDERQTRCLSLPRGN